MIRDCAFDMSNIENLSFSELKKLSQDLGISVSQKSKVAQSALYLLHSIVGT